MNCKNLKIRTKKGKRIFYCSLLKKEITFDCCRGCINKKYKEYKKLESKTEIKQRTYKQAKAEKNRFSLFTNDLNHCIICGKPNINLHEIFYGKNRQNSIKYGLVIPLCCEKHHDQVNCRGIHFEPELCDKWQKIGQTKFNEIYPKLDFLEIFHEDYLNKKIKK